MQMTSLDITMVVILFFSSSSRGANGWEVVRCVPLIFFPICSPIVPGSKMRTISRTCYCVGDMFGQAQVGLLGICWEVDVDPQVWEVEEAMQDV